ncbi:MAG TPA: hypothetical protein VLA79_02200 [Polyangia bacterium]|nr:hypothetical protein [Polyangia bacterium]
MKSLAPCPGCARHVKPDETVCPFCQEALVSQPVSVACQGPCTGHRSPRLGRAALMAAGAALLCAACQRSSAALYGGAIFDSGAQTVDAGTQTDAGVDASDAAK